MPNRKAPRRLKYDLKDKRLIAQYSGGIDIITGYGYCAMCGLSFPLQNLEVDHIIPLSKGGTDRVSNLRLLCSRCNRIKGARKPKQTKPKQTERTGWF